ncbi:MAG: purple acid phosphatase family protein, partial [Actinomycetes bacterium]
PRVADSTSRHHHQVTVTGLAPATQHSYTVASGGTSASGSVRTAAGPGRAFTFAAISDFGGGGPAERQNAERIAGFGGDFLLTVGDNVYPSSGFVDPDVATTYADLDARLFEQFTPVLRTQAFFPANGNKEYYGSEQFWNAFPMPAPGSGWYGLDWGDAHVLVLDSLRPYGPGSPQYAFAEAELAARQQAAWQIVVVHSPPYNSTSSPAGGSPGVRRDLVPLFERHGVDLVLSGDSHNYQRSKPLLGGAPAPGGVTYVLTGGGGNGLNVFSGPMPDWLAYREASYQSLKVDVSATALTVSAIAAADGAVLDTVTMSRPANGGS